MPILRSIKNQLASVVPTAKPMSGVTDPLLASGVVTPEQIAAATAVASPVGTGPNIYGEGTRHGPTPPLPTGYVAPPKPYVSPTGQWPYTGGNENSNSISSNGASGGIIGGIQDQLFGPSGHPILQAAQIQADALQDAIPFFEPFLEYGTQGLEGYAAGATPQGLSDTIDQIMSGSLFGGLVDERRNEVQNMLSAGGMMRSGRAVEEGAAIPTDIALALEGVLRGRQGGLAEMGFGGATNIANLTTQVGEAIASGILGLEAQRAAAKATKDTNKSNLLGSLISGGASLLGGFSDPALKENVKAVRKVGPLTLVTWDWIPETKGTIVENMSRVGFMADEVQEHFPEVVSEFGGYRLIDYPSLFNRLNNATTDS